jgi:hypothetical protein
MTETHFLVSSEEESERAAAFVLVPFFFFFFFFFSPLAPLFALSMLAEPRGRLGG